MGSLLGLIFCNSIHLEVASSPFCLLINSSWLLVFALCVFFLILSGFNLYCWKGIHFSWSYSFVLLLLHIGLIFAFHFWFRVLLIIFFLLGITIILQIITGIFLGFWRILCSQSNIKEVLHFSLHSSISSLWF